MYGKLSLMLVFALLGAKATAQQPPKKSKMAVLDLKDKGVGAEVASLLTGIVSNRLSEIGIFEVISREDIKNMLTHEQDKILVGCSDTGCLSEIGGALGVENLSTWAHELVHAADDRLGQLKERGQHWRSETVAELGGAVLLEVLGYETDSDRGGCWEYVTAYATDAGIEPVTACQRVLKRMCEAVALILDTAETLAVEEVAHVE